MKTRGAWRAISRLDRKRLTRELMEMGLKYRNCGWDETDKRKRGFYMGTYIFDYVRPSFSISKNEILQEHDPQRPWTTPKVSIVMRLSR